MKKLNWFLSKFNTLETIDWGIYSNTHLDMGCGNSPRNPFFAKNLIGADILDPDILNVAGEFTYLRIDLSGHIPLETKSIDSISGYDFLEHLPRGASVESNLFIRFMNEASRILKDGGVLMLVTPAFPSSAAFQDPTHVNFISEETINYFIGHNPDAKNLGYGFEGSFKLLSQEWVGPLSKVWSKTFDLQVSQGKKSARFQFFKNFSSIRATRRTISAIRKPTHLLWLLQKI